MTIKRQIMHIGDRTIERMLLVADEGMELSNDGGDTRHNCVAVLTADGWKEYTALTADEPISDREALDIITGGVSK